MNVNAPASRLPYILGGGIAGNYVSKWLGVNNTLGILGGALVGNSLYNRQYPDPNKLSGGFRRI